MGRGLQQVFALIAVAIGCLLAFGNASLAQQPPSGGYNAFIVGDGLAGGLWAGTTRVGGRYPDFAVTGRFKEESGLARPEIYDWASAIPKILERNQVDIAIVLIGTNDRQDIRSESGRLAFGSPEWAAAYAADVDEIVRVFIDNGAAVYWVGLPPMRQPQHEEAVSAIAKLQRERVLAGGAKYIDVRPEFSNADGSYAESGIGIDGSQLRLRSLDGIKFIKAGNDKLAAVVFDAISADLGLAAPGTVVAEGGNGVGEGGANLPVFGMALADGGIRILSPSELPLELADQHQVQGARVDLDQAADTPAAPDSAAAALFDAGQWPAAKPGRIDDFSWPQTQ